jgi:excisionase family DNA binding protein
MAMVTLGEAARLTGLGKTTLARAIKAGRLSATRTDLGSFRSSLPSWSAFTPLLPLRWPLVLVSATSILAHH